MQNLPQGSCPLCSGNAAKQLKLPHTVIWKCRSSDCGLEFASPQPGETELAKFYSNLYYPGPKAGSSFQRDGTPDAILRQVLPQLEASLGTLKGLRLLDYGCGRGPLLQIASELGFAPIGIEPDSVARSMAMKQVGVRVYACLPELLSRYPEAQFDLIILWNVIEHLRQPWLDLQEMRSLLRSGGSLLICTMNTGCLRARIERERWMSYEDPTHFYYFNRRSLGRLLSFGGYQRTQEWKPKIRYPHHGVLRRCLYGVSNAFGIADGLYYLCSRAA
jgi:SAM-dependent methyltransferase